MIEDLRAFRRCGQGRARTARECRLAQSRWGRVDAGMLVMSAFQIGLLARFCAWQGVCGSMGVLLLVAQLSCSSLPEDLGASGQDDLVHLLTRDAFELEPSADALLYSTLQPGYFVNHASTQTTLVLPQGTRIEVAADETLNFPDGTLIIKTFYYQRVDVDPSREREGSGPGCRGGDEVSLAKPRPNGKRSDVGVASPCLLEARVLARRAGEWRGRTYVWRDDASTVEVPGGMEVALVGYDESGRRMTLDHLVPSRAQCGICHSGSADDELLEPIGLRLSRLGPEAIESLASYAVDEASFRDAYDAVQGRLREVPVARRYLASNCAFCHNPRGFAASSGLFLGWNESELDRLGLCQLPTALGVSIPGARFDIEPGHPERSLLLARMKSLEPGVVMPELGRSLVDEDGVDTVAGWIQDLPGHCD